MSITSILFSLPLFTANNRSVIGSNAVISAAPRPPKLIEATSVYALKSSFCVFSNGGAISSLRQENKVIETISK